MKKRNKRNAKIVATLGPASSTPEVIREMIASGMNVARLNFSHGTHEEHAKVLGYVRQEAAKLGQHIAVLQDLCGPKIRISTLKNSEILLVEGEKINLRYTMTAEQGDKDNLFIDIFDPTKVIREGEKVLLADGRIVLLAEKTNSDSVTCKVIGPGILRSKAGISVPESDLDLPCLTEKDKEDIKWGMQNDIDYVALSFVGSQQDLRETRDEMTKYGKPLPLVAKIERVKALDDVSSIIKNSDAVMVARGDLGVDLPLEKVPGAQRLIISSSNFEGTPVITATQMLMSMVEQNRPTRAEVSDVVTAVRDGTDAVMLSEETAVGKHPAHAIRVLSDIVAEAEREIRVESGKLNLRHSDRANVSDAICYAACNAAEKISATAILACTETGSTARLMAKYRPNQPLIWSNFSKKIIK